MLSTSLNKWSLFLDRDGVVNKRLPGRYVKNWEEFRFGEGVLPSMAFFASIFNPILIVTNQQGIGKKIMTEKELSLVHEKMLSEISQAGGRVDKIYFCPDLNSDHPNCRKPNPAMGIMAKQDFPTIDFQKSIIVGDSISDIEFGYRLGMTTVLVRTKPEAMTKLLKQPSLQKMIDHQCEDLRGFVDLLKNSSITKFNI